MKEKFILDSIYHLIIFFTLVYSNYLCFIKHKKTLNLNYYFIGICCLELLLNTSFKDKNLIHFISIIILTLFFWHFSFSILRSRKLKIVQNMIAFVVILYLIYARFFCSNITVFMIYSIFLIISCLIYFIDILFYTTKYELTKKLEFWFILGNLFWAFFFVYRVGVMNYFKNTDVSFLQLISEFFTIVNITTYLIFIKGISCSQSKR